MWKWLGAVLGALLVLSVVLLIVIRMDWLGRREVDGRGRRHSPALRRL
jgi:hypothetical protein